MAFIIVSTSAFPFQDNSASKAATLNTISGRDQTPSNDLPHDQFLGSLDLGGSSLGLAADENNEQQLIPLDGLDSAENLEIPGSSSDQADPNAASSPAVGTSDMASRPQCAGEAKQVEKRSNAKDGSTLVGGMHRQFQFHLFSTAQNLG